MIFNISIADLTSDAPVIANKSNEEDEEMSRALAASVESMEDTSSVNSKDKDVIVTQKEEETNSTEKPAYPPLPEEPKGDRSLLCKVGIRLPDGRRVQRNFLRTDPVQVSLCYEALVSVIQSSVINIVHTLVYMFNFGG